MEDTGIEPVTSALQRRDVAPRLQAFRGLQTRRDQSVTRATHPQGSHRRSARGAVREDTYPPPVPSRALESWEVGERAPRVSTSCSECTCASLAEAAAGASWATRELNAAIVVHVAAHQQLFCRDLHTEAADALVDAAPAPYRPMLRRWYTDRRSLDGGNAWPETIDRDFARFDLDVWAVARLRDSRTAARRPSSPVEHLAQRDRPSGLLLQCRATEPPCRHGPHTRVGSPMAGRLHRTRTDPRRGRG